MSLTAFRCTSLTQDYNLELQYRKPFLDIWQEEKDGPILGPLSVRMGVRARGDGPMLVSEEELEAASKFSIFIVVSFTSTSFLMLLQAFTMHSVSIRFEACLNGGGYLPHFICVHIIWRVIRTSCH